MAPFQYATSFAGDTNEVGLINNDIAKFSNSRGYGVGLSCEETLDEELNSEDPVTLFACITVGGVPPKCEKPADQVSLTFLSGSDTVFVKDACDSRLKKYIVSQEFDGVRTLVSEQKAYQREHQVFRGTNVDDSPDLKLNSNEKTLAFAGYTTMISGYTPYYHNYRLELKCSEV